MSVYYALCVLHFVVNSVIFTVFCCNGNFVVYSHVCGQSVHFYLFIFFIQSFIVLYLWLTTYFRHFLHPQC